MTDITLPMEFVRIEPGMTFFFGASRIPWVVLDRIPGTDQILVLSQREVENRKFHEEWTDVTWETSSLRRWLNGEFYFHSFTGEEQEAIVPYEISVWERKPSGGKAVKEINDRIFLLSIAEANYYLQSAGDSADFPFWLRPAGEQQINAPQFFAGEADDRGIPVIEKSGVRPAMILDLGAPVFRPFLWRDKGGRPEELRISPYHLTGTVLDGVLGERETEELPEGISEIGPKVFFHCRKLRRVSFPSSLGYIGDEAFSGCHQLKEIKSSSRSLGYGKDVFADCEELSLTPDLFLNTKPLPGLFTRMLSADPEFADEKALAWMYLFQRGIHWDEARMARLSPKNIPRIAEEILALKEGRGEVRVKEEEALKILRSFAFYLSPEMKKRCLGEKEGDPDRLILTDGTVLMLPCRIEVEEGNIIPLGPGFEIHRVGTKTDNVLVRMDQDEYAKRWMPLELRELTTSGKRPKYAKNQTLRLSLSRGIMEGRLVEGAEGKRYLDWYAVSVKDGMLTSAASNLEKLILPAEIKEVSARALQNNEGLRYLDWEGEMPQIPPAALASCTRLRLPGKVFCCKDKAADGFASFIPEDDAKAVACELTYRGSSTEILSEKIREEHVPAIAEEILKLLREDPDFSGYPERAGNLLRFSLAAAPLLSREQKKEMQNAIRKNSFLGTRLLDREISGHAGGPKIFGRYAFRTNLKILSDGSAVISPKLPSFAGIMEAVGPYEEEGNKWIEQDSGYSWIEENHRYRMKKHPEADRLAAGMVHDALIEFVEIFRRKSDFWESGRNTRFHVFNVPFAAFASREEMQIVIRGTRKGVTYEEKQLREAIFLNDTPEAVLFAFNEKRLADYAAKREKDEEDYRLLVCELKGYTPKKGKAAAEKGRKILAKFLREDFLWKREISPECFKSRYLDDTLLTDLAKGLLWLSGNTVFAVNRQGEPVDISGMPVSLSDGKVVLAHPMEMSAKERVCWKDWLSREGIRQPFPQMEEYVPENYRQDPGFVFEECSRYRGCLVSRAAVLEAEKAGFAFHYQEIRDGKTQIASLVPVRDSVYSNHPENYEIQEFLAGSYTRRINRLVGIFDRYSVPSRILKDDVTVRRWLSSFTPEEIDGFIDMAAKNGCTNVTSMLLAWKDGRDEETADPMDIFRL